MRIGIAGCTGRMGIAVAHAARELGDAEISVGSVRLGKHHPTQDFWIGQGLSSMDVPIVVAPDDLFASADLVIDFSTPELTVALAHAAARAGKPLVSGTTGLSHSEMGELAAAAKDAPILWASNLSLGVAILTRLVREAASQLDHQFDIEIVEMHHRHKKDAPSGTALSLGKAAAAARGVDFDEVAVLSREGQTGERKAGSIGFASLRGGEVVGDHSVIFAGAHERIELTHKSSDRGIYAHGAVHAARWLNGKPAGLYSMDDMVS